MSLISSVTQNPISNALSLSVAIESQPVTSTLSPDLICTTNKWIHKVAVDKFFVYALKNQTRTRFAGKNRLNKEEMTSTTKQSQAQNVFKSELNRRIKLVALEKIELEKCLNSLFKPLIIIFYDFSRVEIPI